MRGLTSVHDRVGLHTCRRSNLLELPKAKDSSHLYARCRVRRWGKEAAKEAVWIRGFINDLRIPGIFVKSVPLYVDYNSALKLTRNPEYHSKSKHIDVKHHFIRQKVEEGAINTERVGTKDNLADVLTKALPRDTHEDLVGRMGMFGTRS